MAPIRNAVPKSTSNTAWFEYLCVLYRIFVLTAADIMTKKCVAQFCSNSSNKEQGISIHKFLAIEDSARQQWIRFVRTKRAEWKPTDSSVLCSRHFTPSCFENWSQVKAGLSSKLLLIEGSVPTLHADPHSQCQEQPTPTNRSCVRKRTVHQVG